LGGDGTATFLLAQPRSKKLPTHPPGWYVGRSRASYLLTDRADRETNMPQPPLPPSRKFVEAVRQSCREVRLAQGIKVSQGVSVCVCVCCSFLFGFHRAPSSSFPMGQCWRCLLSTYFPSSRLFPGPILWLRASPSGTLVSAIYSPERECMAYLFAISRRYSP
jgi:hypothetical protein